jgi:membrane associated rhomboid family serine protease
VRAEYGPPRPIVFGGDMAPGVRTLLFTTTGLFLFQVVAGYLAGVRFERLFGLVPYDVTHHLFLWQMVSYLFLHGGFWHILLNMLALYMFGSRLEWLWGTDRFLRFYFITGIGAAVCSVVVSPSSTIPIIGASGAIFGLLAAYGLLFPDETLLLYFVIPIKAKYFVLFLGLFTFWMSLTSSGTGVAHVAHLGGMLFGYAYLRWFADGTSRLGRIRLPFLDRRSSSEREQDERERRERKRERERERLRKKFQVYYQETRGEDDPED